jgi:cytosine/adenosine deaminase-related metal-dependent hydrolase
MPDPSVVNPLITALAEAGVAIMTAGNASRPVPPLPLLAREGVVVCSGSDGIRDTWGPYGNADMLERATLLGLRNNLRRDDELPVALAACTTNGAVALGLADYGLAVGCHADFLLIDAETLAEAIAQHPPGRTVVRRGHIVATDGVVNFTSPG